MIKKLLLSLFIICFLLVIIYLNRGNIMRAIWTADIPFRSQVLTYLTTEDASWEYIDKSLGGMKAIAATKENETIIKFEFVLHEISAMNSMHCIRDIQGKVKNEKILINLRYCMCNDWNSQNSSESVTIKQLKPGNYTIIYNDASAGHPELGNINIARSKNS
ncbi:hypothetical protein [Desulforhopalus sp. 52FAK]